MDYAYVIRTLFAAGIRLTEAAYIFNVNRQTLYNWKKDNQAFIKSRYNGRVIIIVRRIKDRLDAGLLPLDSCSSIERYSKLQNMLN
jgi:hypothetical protein